MSQAIDDLDFNELKHLMTYPKERYQSDAEDWDAYWYERDEYENTNPLVLDCNNPDCIMSGYHRLSECITAEEMEGIYADFEYLSRPFRTVFRPVGLRGRSLPFWQSGVTWWPCAFAAMERPGQR